MNSKQRPIIMIISGILLFSFLFATVAVAALAEDGMSALWRNTDDQDGTVKYEKPAVGDIAQDGAYPDEVKSNSSANAQEKEWYEYITYSKTPIGEIQFENLKLVFYDPYDYNYGTIMVFSDPKSDFGDYYDPEGYTTANEITVSYSFSKSHSWASDVSVDFGFEEEVGFEAGAVALAKFSQQVGVSHTQSGSEDSSASKDVTYNALYFNSNGTPYRWRIVKYTVYLPLYCELQTLTNEQWVVKETNYCILATVQGTCREWINNVAYIEEWRTGEPIQVEKFWEKYFSETSLILAYTMKLIPQN